MNIDMFLGFLIGMVVGSFIGMLIAGLMTMASNQHERIINLDNLRKSTRDEHEDLTK